MRLSHVWKRAGAQSGYAWRDLGTEAGSLGADISVAAVASPLSYSLSEPDGGFTFVHSLSDWSGIDRHAGGST